MDWHSYFLNIAAAVARKSKDPNTKVGAVIVRDKRILSTGYNGMVSGAVEIWTRPEKYEHVVHAEANAISFAARNGSAVEGGAIYITHAPCLNCAKLILQAGICALYYRKGSESVKYGPELEKSRSLFHSKAFIFEAWAENRLEEEQCPSSSK